MERPLTKKNARSPGDIPWRGRPTSTRSVWPGLYAASSTGSYPAARTSATARAALGALPAARPGAPLALHLGGDVLALDGVLLRAVLLVRPAAAPGSPPPRRRTGRRSSRSPRSRPRAPRWWRRCRTAGASSAGSGERRATRSRRGTLRRLQGAATKALASSARSSQTPTASSAGSATRIQPFILRPIGLKSRAPSRLSSSSRSGGSLSSSSPSYSQANILRPVFRHRWPNITPVRTAGSACSSSAMISYVPAATPPMVARARAEVNGTCGHPAAR